MTGPKERPNPQPTPAARAGAEVAVARRSHSPGLKWVIIGMLFLATIVNYIDRQSVSLLATVLQADLRLSTFQYGEISAVFLVAYALSMWVWGAVFDRIGNRIGFAVANVGWSLSEMAHALARGAFSLGVARGFLGAGESGNWPGVTRTVAEWFPAKQRALAMGIANTGAALGSAVAPPIIISLQLAFGWKTVFLATGALGMIWTLAWLATYPAGRSANSPAAPSVDRFSNALSGPLGPPEGAPPPRPVPWGELLRHRQVWGIVIGRFFGDPIWWLYLNWLPKYLADARGFSLSQIAFSAWVPFTAAGLGSVGGGWFSSHLLHRGWTVNRARKTAIVVATVLMPAGALSIVSPSPYAALAWMCVTLFGFQFWVGNVQTLPSDLFPVGAVGSIAGFSGTAAGIGAAILTFSTGWVVERFSYTPILIISALLGPLATASLFALCGRIAPVERPGRAPKPA